jgi:hypothetical protein
MRVIAVKSDIGFPLVRVYDRASLDILPYYALQRAFGRVRDNHGHNSALPLDNPENRDFADCAAPFDDVLVGMPFSFLAADVSLVAFDNAFENII